MSATVVSRRIYDAFLGPDLGAETLYHGHSYGGNALAAAVASKHLELMESWNVLANVRARSRELRAALSSQLEPLPWIRALRVCGLMAAVELRVEAGSLQPRRVVASMINRGVLSRSLGPAVTIVPPLTTTASEIELIVSTLRDALEECMR